MEHRRDGSSNHQHEVVKAFVTLKRGFQPSDDLELDIMNHIRKRLSPLLFKNGQVAATKIGALPKSKLKEWVESVI